LKEMGEGIESRIIAAIPKSQDLWFYLFSMIH